MLQEKMIDAKKSEQDFKQIYTQSIKRDGADKLLEFLDKSDFFTAPASSRFHNSCEGGLCQHSINVYHCLKDYLDGNFQKNVFKMDYPEETIAVVSLLHDVCKIDNYRTDFRNVKNEQGIWERVPYYVPDDKIPFGHGEKSVWMIMSFMKLSREEAMAIRWHMGFTEEGKFSMVGKAFEMFPLAFALSTADMEATYFVEGG